VPELPDGFWYTAKRSLLGPPLVTEQLTSERLSKPLALGVLSCDGLSLHAKRTRTVRNDGLRDYEWPEPPPGTDPIGSLRQPGHATVQGRLHVAQVRPVPRNNVLAFEVADSTGELTAVFYGRTQIAGIEPGRQVRLHGMVGIGGDGRPAMINPACEPLR
jgi:hypothetical protein